MKRHVMKAMLLAALVLMVGCDPAGEAEFLDVITDWEGDDAKTDDETEATPVCSSDGDCASIGHFCVAGACVPNPDFSGGPDEAAQTAWDTLGESGAGGAEIPWGGKVGEFCGVPAFSNGNQGATCCWTSSNGSSIYGLKYQCTELAFRYLCEVYDILGCRSTGKQGRRYGNAAQWYDNELSHPVLAELETHPNGGVQPPRVGDLLIFAATQTNEYGHVTVVTAVGDDYVTVIEQNVTSTAQDGAHNHVLRFDGVGYEISGARGWMSPPEPGLCEAHLPILITPADEAAFGSGATINFTWQLGRQGANHFLRIRHLESDAIIYEANQGFIGSQPFNPTLAGRYRWTVYYEHETCPDGTCVAPPREFVVVNDSTGCASNACSSRASGRYCDQGEVVECAMNTEGCSYVVGRHSCAAGEICDAGSCVSTGCTSCPSTQYGTWGECDYETVCDQAARRLRSETTYSCDGSSCVPSVADGAETCARSTDGQVCDASGTCSNSLCCSEGCQTAGTRTPNSTEHEAGGQVLKLEVTSTSSCGALTLRVSKPDGTALGTGHYDLRVGSCRVFGAIRTSVTLSAPTTHFDVTTPFNGNIGDVKELCATKVASTVTANEHNAWWYSNFAMVTMSQTCQ